MRVPQHQQRAKTTVMRFSRGVADRDKALHIRTPEVEQTFTNCYHTHLRPKSSRTEDEVWAPIQSRQAGGPTDAYLHPFPHRPCPSLCGTFSSSQTAPPPHLPLRCLGSAQGRPGAGSPVFREGRCWCETSRENTASTGYRSLKQSETSSAPRVVSAL